jgi:hypothetical protein
MPALLPDFILLAIAAGLLHLAGLFALARELMTAMRERSED